MKKLLYIIMLMMVMVQGSVPAAMAGFVVGGDDAVVAPTDITFWWRCEGTTLGEDDYSAGDTTATLSGAAINTDAVKIGTNGLDSPSNNDYAYFSVSSDDIIDAAKGRLGCWVYVTTSQENSSVLWFASTATGGDPQGGADGIALIIMSDGRLFYGWDDGTNDYFSDISHTINDDEWYFIELEWDVATNSRKLYVDGVEEYSDTSTLVDFEITYLQLGTTNAQISDNYIDNVMVSDLSIARDFNNDTFSGTTYKNLTASPR